MIHQIEFPLINSVDFQKIGGWQLIVK